MVVPGAPRTTWRVHLRAPVDEVWRRLTTREGRESFWAEEAPSAGEGEMAFRFPNGQRTRAEVLESAPPDLLVLRYFGLRTRFELVSDGRGGTELTLTSEPPPPEDRDDVVAGWVSVLLALKAAVEFGVDLRNHDPGRTWDQGYVDQ